MDFELSDDQSTIRDMATSFAAEAIAPHALDWDQTKHFPVETLRAAAALGLAGITTREDLGGSGLGRLDAVLIFEALAKGCPTVAAFLSIHNMCTSIVDTYGSPEQRRAWLPSLTSMATIASYCLTEPGCRFGRGGLEEPGCIRDGEHYVLDGQKQFISGAGTSDVYIVMARTGADARSTRHLGSSSCEKDTPGLSFGVGREEDGLERPADSRGRLLEGVRVPVGQ